MQPCAARQHPRGGNLRIQLRVCARREVRTRSEADSEGGDARHLVDFLANARVDEDGLPDREVIIEIDAFVVAPQGKAAEAVVGDERVLHLLPIENKTAGQRPEPRDIDGLARFGMAADVLVGAVAEWADEEAVVEEEAAEDILPETAGDVVLIVESVSRGIVLLAAHQIESGEQACRIGAVGAGLTGAGRVEIPEGEEALRAPPM